MLNKKISRANVQARSNNKKINNNNCPDKDIPKRKWFDYYDKYPSDYIMTAKDVDISILRIKNYKTQGILLCEKQAFFNFYEFIKKKEV